MLTNPKTLFLKIAGVTPLELAGLHGRLSSLPSLLPNKPPEYAVVQRSGDGGLNDLKVEFTDLLKSVLDKESSTYTVEIRIDAAIACDVFRLEKKADRFLAEKQKRVKALLLAPRLVLDHILAVFDGLFPNEVAIQVLDKQD